jgi:hypothetical protein
MPGDAVDRNEDELLSQIDELKARMDRLMSGGSSTSNSALLTDKPEAVPPPAQDVPPPQDTAPPDSGRTRVRDLMETKDSEVIEVYPGPEEVVPFPDREKATALETPPAESPADRPEPVSGSVIAVVDEHKEERPKVARFNDIGSAIQHELARDSSIPPAETKRGPDLASRFGPVDEPSASAPEADETVNEDEPEPADAPDDAKVVVDELVDETEVYADDEKRSASGKVAAIWAFTASASAAIAILHFTGII